METILDKIKYDHKYYSELSDIDSKNKIEKIAFMLSDLENEIIKHEDGEINIFSSGIVYVTDFPEDLSAKITDLISTYLN